MRYQSTGDTLSIATIFFTSVSCGRSIWTITSRAGDESARPSAAVCRGGHDENSQVDGRWGRPASRGGDEKSAGSPDCIHPRRLAVLAPVEPPDELGLGCGPSIGCAGYAYGEERIGGLQFVGAITKLGSEEAMSRPTSCTSCWGMRSASLRMSGRVCSRAPSITTTSCRRSAACADHQAPPHRAGMGARGSQRAMSYPTKAPSSYQARIHCRSRPTHEQEMSSCEIDY